MGDLSKNFSRYEFASGDGDARYATVDAELLTILQAIRDYYRRPVKINSGHRSPKHNKSVGGAAKSWHTTGRAADIQVSGVSSEAVARYVRNNHLINHGGVGVYASFVHLDTRPTIANWRGR